MNPEVKKRWLEALRSGEYKQGRLRLRNNKDEYCCLGVLCDIHSQETKTQWDETDDFMDYCLIENVLPGKVMEWAGLEVPNPNVSAKILATIPSVMGKIRTDSYLSQRIERDNLSLIGLNDSGFTFDEIADVIEKEL